MKLITAALGWLFGCVFILLAALSLVSGHYLPSALALVAAVILLPPLARPARWKKGRRLPGWSRPFAAAALLFLFVFLIFKGMGNRYSIYRDPEIEQGLMRIYDDRMRQWPVPYETRYVDTSYGKVFVVVSGPVDGPPLVLLHASAMASWSWLYNIAGLNEVYRTYAIDTIGDAGRSILADVEVFPDSGRLLSEFYSEIMDSLGIERASFAGASQGGFIATNIALYAPERVDRLVLAGPMGYTGTNASVLRILFTTMFPAGPIKDSAVTWAFGDDLGIRKAVGDWFELILDGVISRQARPRPFTCEQLASLDRPVLLLLGSRDGLVGDTEKAREFARCMPDVTVKVLDTGHLISAEKPEEFNDLVKGFLGAGRDGGSQ